MIFRLLIVLFIFFSCREPSTSGSPSNQITSPEGPIIRYVAPRSGVILREKPSVKSKSLYVIPFRKLLRDPIKTGTCEIIDSKQDCWYKITIDKKNGYVFGGYLSANPPKFIEDFSRDVLNAPVKIMPKVELISSWKIVTEIPGVEFQVPSGFEFNLTKQTNTGKIFHTVGKTATIERFSYYDTAQEKYCKNRPNECGTEGSPTRVNVSFLKEISINDYMKLRIQHDPFEPSYDFVGRIDKPSPGYMILWNSWFNDQFTLIVTRGNGTLVYDVTPPFGPMPQANRLSKSDVEKIFYSLKLVP